VASWSTNKRLIRSTATLHALAVTALGLELTFM
jgi:hypothetical protein